MREAEFLTAVRALARDLGWATYHPLQSKGSEPGWPDLVLARGGRVLFRELKTMQGRTTPAQDDWLDRLATAGLDVGVWRPDDLLAGTVAAELGAYEVPDARQRAAGDDR